jgi:hypothetical protein
MTRLSYYQNTEFLEISLRHLKKDCQDPQGQESVNYLKPTRLPIRQPSIHTRDLSCATRLKDQTMVGPPHQTIEHLGKTEDRKQTLFRKTNDR